MRANARRHRAAARRIPLTRDQLKMLEARRQRRTTDDAVETFGVPLVPLDEQLRRAARNPPSSTVVTERLARACARHPWRTIGAWIAAIVVAFAVIASSLGDG